MSVDTKVTDLIINTGLTKQELNEKYAQGVIGDNELSIVDTEENVVQVDEMPVASASNVGDIVQYAGNDTQDYTNGYFYESTAGEQGPGSATISQTVGSGLSDLAVDASTFETAEQPTGDETVDFVASVVPAYVTPTSFDWGGATLTVDSAVFLQWIEDTTGGAIDWSIVNEIDINHIIDDNTWGFWVFDPNYNTLASQTGISQPQGVSLDGVPPNSYNAVMVYTPTGVTWSKDNQVVDLATYGITYTGTPADGDTLTVDYTAGQISYLWKQKDVQPSRGGIEWASSLDLPQGYSYNSCRAMLKLGNLPDGRYEFYTSVKMYGDADTGRVFVNSIARFEMDLHGNDYSCISIQPDLGNGWVNTNTKSLLRGTSFNNCLYQNNGELFLRLSHYGLFLTDIGQYFPSYTAEDAKDCFRVSKIKNLTTGEEYDASFMVDSYVGMSDLWSFAQISPIVQEKWYQTQVGQSPVFSSGLPGYICQYATYASTNITQNDAVLSLRASNGAFVARIQFKQNNKFAVTVEEETGILVGTKVGTVNNYIGIAVKVPTTAYGVQLQLYWGIGAFDDSLAQYLNIWTLEDWMTLNEIGTLNPGALITEDNLGNIVQYSGTTNANYTNGYFYKANGTLVVTPGSVDATCTNYPQVTVSIDIDGFRAAYETTWGVQSDQWWTDALGNWGYVFQYNVDSNELYWPAIGWLPSSFLSYFTFSELIPGSVYNISTANYVPQSRSIQNQSWDRIDVQPAQANTTYQPFSAGWDVSHTTKDFCDDVNADASAIEGMAYLGEVTFTDMPSNLGNAECIVEIMMQNPSNKIITLTLTSGTTAPYMWKYTYWNNGSNVSGWKTWVTESQLATVATTGEYGDLNNLPDIPDRMQFGIMPDPAGYLGGQPVQYVGSTDANYTNGYFYEGETTSTTPASATATQTVGSSLSNLSVNVSTFQNAIETYDQDIWEDHTYVFTYASGDENWSDPILGNLDITALGVSFTGTPIDGDKVTVVYTAEVETYGWRQINVQPQGSSLPSQTGNAGKFLTTDGTDASWSDKPIINNASTSGQLNICPVGGTPNTTDAYGQSIVIGNNIKGGTGVSYGSVRIGNNINTSNAMYGDKGVFISGGGGISKAGGSLIINGASYSTTNNSGRVGGVIIGSGFVPVYIGALPGTTEKGGAFSIAIGGSSNHSVSVNADYTLLFNTGYDTATAIEDANTFWWGNQNGLYKLFDTDGTIPEARLADTTSATAGRVLTLDNNLNAVWATPSSGGSVPSLTWYTVSTAGNTLTIADTSSAQLVKIYKNGLLLQPTEDYTISGTTLTTVAALVVGDKITTEVF